MNKQETKEYLTGTFIMDRCTVIVTKDANEFWQLIVSLPDNKPSYKEVIKARYKYLPDDIVMAQIFPPREDFEQIPGNAHFLTQLTK